MTTAAANELSTAARAMNRTQAAAFCTTEYARLAALLRQLTPDEWRRPTECAPWDVRAMAGHLVGAAEAASLPAFVGQALAGLRVHRKPGLGNLVDGINEVQIRAAVVAHHRCARRCPRARRGGPGAREPEPRLVHAADAHPHAGELGVAAHAEGARAQPRPLDPPRRHLSRHRAPHGADGGPRWRHRRGHRGRVGRASSTAVRAGARRARRRHVRTGRARAQCDSTPSTSAGSSAAGPGDGCSPRGVVLGGRPFMGRLDHLPRSTAELTDDELPHAREPLLLALVAGAPLVRLAVGPSRRHVFVIAEFR